MTGKAPDGGPEASGTGACVRFAPRDLALPLDTILRMQGYKDLGAVRPRVRESAVRALAEAERLIAPEACYRRVAVEDCGNGVLRLAEGTTFHGTTFDRTLAGCPAVVVFVLTLGEAIDNASDALQDDNLLDAYFLETAGWLATERATRALMQHLAAETARCGLRLTRRLAPGYGDWPLEEQVGLFELFAGVELPVRLLESQAMLPRKSRSGLWGLRPAGGAGGAPE